MTTDATATNPPVPAAAVRVSGLQYHYPDGRHALRGVDLAIRPGEAFNNPHKSSIEYA